MFSYKSYHMYNRKPISPTLPVYATKFHTPTLPIPLILINYVFSALQGGSRREKERRDEGPTIGERALRTAGWNGWLNGNEARKAEWSGKKAYSPSYGNLMGISYVLCVIEKPGCFTGHSLFSVIKNYWPTINNERSSSSIVYP